MRHEDFEHLKTALKCELELWRPSEQDFETTMIKAKSFSGIGKIQLTDEQKRVVRKMYDDAREDEWREKASEK